MYTWNCSQNAKSISLTLVIIFGLKHKMQWGIADFNAATATRIEEFKTHLAPSLTPLLASNAANTTINTIEKSAFPISSFPISHFLISHSSF